MKESTSGSRTVFQDPIQSKMHLSNFSPTTSKKSQLYPKRNQARDEIFCELCLRNYKISAFRDHLHQHRRPPKDKLPSLKEIYSSAHQFRSDLDSETIIQALDSKKNIVLEQSEYHYETFYGPDDYLNQKFSYVPHSPQKEKLKFSSSSLRKDYLEDRA